MKPIRRKVTTRVHAARVNAFRRKLLHWFDTAGREFPWRAADATPYIQVLIEVLVQQTRADNVAAVLPAFLQKYPDWGSIATARIVELERLLQPLGLWRRRARALKNLATALKERDWEWPVDREDLEALPAVGQYVASAVRVFVHHQREVLLDTNMARLLERYFGPRLLADIRYDPWLKHLSQQLIESENPCHVNWAVLDFGALVCTARNPRCTACPLKRGCIYFVQVRTGGGG